MPDNAAAATLALWRQLHAAITAISSGGDLTYALHELAELVRSATTAPLVSVHLVDGADVEVAAITGGDPDEETAQLQGRRVPLRVWERMLAEPGDPDGPVLTPMRTLAGQFVGVIAAERQPDAAPRTPQQQELVSIAAAQVALALDNRAQLSTLRRGHERLQVREETLRLTMADAPIGMCLINLAPGGRGQIVQVNRALCELFGYREPDFARLELVDLLDCADVGDRLAGLAAAGSGPRTVHRHECRCLRSDASGFWALIHAIVLPTTTDEPPLLMAQVMDITGRQAGGREPTRRAIRDPLTGLLNQAMTKQRLDRALETDPDPARPGAVLHCAFDEIPELRAAAGHVVADEVLLTLARRISGVVRKSDTVGRVGANRFVMIVPEITPAGADQLAERIERAVTAPVSVRGQTYEHHTKVTVVSLADQHAVNDLQAEFDAAC